MNWFILRKELLSNPRYWIFWFLLTFNPTGRKAKRGLCGAYFQIKTREDIENELKEVRAHLEDEAPHKLQDAEIRYRRLRTANQLLVIDIMNNRFQEQKPSETPPLKGDTFTFYFDYEKKRLLESIHSHWFGF